MKPWRLLTCNFIAPSRKNGVLMEKKKKRRWKLMGRRPGEEDPPQKMTLENTGPFKFGRTEVEWRYFFFPPKNTWQASKTELQKEKLLKLKCHTELELRLA